MTKIGKKLDKLLDFLIALPGEVLIKKKCKHKFNDPVCIRSGELSYYHSQCRICGEEITTGITDD